MIELFSKLLHLKTKIGYIVKKIIGSIALIIALIGACGRVEKKPLHDAGQFAELYAEIQWAMQSYKQANQAAVLDSLTRRRLVDSVLAKHQLNREQLATVVNDFSEDPQRWREVFQGVVQKFDSLSRPTNQQRRAVSVD